ncbi:MAG TPA: hypothetical protein IAA13_00375, partial [Candidatus Alistipes merdigallinarum]|nr:hypothetical protein [Candidatus Alistipes merdigallinarum]
SEEGDDIKKQEECKKKIYGFTDTITQCTKAVLYISIVVNNPVLSTQKYVNKVLNDQIKI